MPKIRYSVTIEPLSPEAQRNWGPDYHYMFSFNKHYGDINSYGGAARTREELLAVFHRMHLAWEGFDYILERKGDRVTPKNLSFESRCKDVEKSDLFSQLSLTGEIPI